MAEGDRTGGPAATGGGATGELLRAVRIHLDRVHDAVLRTGCRPEQAVQVVRDSALAVVDRPPAGVGQAVGAWFGEALARGRDAAGTPPHHASDEVDGALAALPEPDRSALLLRDGYELPTAVVAAALGTSVDEAQDVVARARLALPGHAGSRPLSGLVVTALPEPDRGQVLHAVEERVAQHLAAAAGGAGVAAGRGAPVDSGPVDRGPVDRGPVGRVPVDRVPVDSGPVDGGRVASGPVDRGPVDSGRIDGVPVDSGPVEAVLVDEPPPRLLSPLLAVLSVVLAVLAGVGIGLLLSARDDVEPLAGADGEIPPGVVLVTPQPSAPAVPPSPPTVPETRPETRVVVVPPSPLPTPTPSPTPTPTPTPDPTLALSPASGPNGSTVIVTGAGFAPGAQVRIDYLDTAGEPTGSSAVAVAADDGSVSTELAVQDPAAVPGPHDVVATAGEVTVRATFTAQE